MKECIFLASCYSDPDDSLLVTTTGKPDYPVTVTALVEGQPVDYPTVLSRKDTEELIIALQKALEK